MSSLLETIAALEHTLNALLLKMKSLEQENQQLLEQLHTVDGLYKDQLLVTAHWQKEYQSLQIAHAITGSEEQKRVAKLKINSLIRDIDDCIAQLTQ